MNDEFEKRRRQRAIITAVLLVGMAALFYFITLARLTQEAAK
jgi:hypothetical protein